MNKTTACVIFTLCMMATHSSVSMVSAQIKDLERDRMCEALEDLKLKDAYVISAVISPAEGDLPERCWIDGFILPEIHFRINLPTKDWNGKFFMEGCGGFCGYLGFSGNLRQALERGYAVSTMDSGHWGESVWDCRWAYNNRIAEIDWAYRAVHETAIVTKRIIDKFYGRPPRLSYFLGCSTGGRMALMEAWRYPEDFDGIISDGPVMDNTGLYISYHWAARKNIGADGKDIISPDDLELIINSVYQACDSLDGRKDGLIEDPSACVFEPESLLCGENQTEGCLTSEQVETLKAWYGGPKNSSGEQLYPGGIPLGSEPFWTRWIIGKSDEIDDSVIGSASLEFFRYVAFQEDPGENYSMFDFDFDTDPPRLEFMAKIINSDNPDLEVFRAKNGKLIMIHGWADAIVTPWKSIEYYKEVENAIGSREDTQEFFRLFMIPGMDHCGIGKELGITNNSLDPLTALEKWVETGEAPESLIITKFDHEGNPSWERPVYPYP